MSKSSYQVYLYIHWKKVDAIIQSFYINRFCTCSFHISPTHLCYWLLNNEWKSLSKCGLFQFSTKSTNMPNFSSIVYPNSSLLKLFPDTKQKLKCYSHIWFYVCLSNILFAPPPSLFNIYIRADCWETRTPQKAPFQLEKLWRECWLNPRAHN